MMILFPVHPCDAIQNKDTCLHGTCESDCQTDCRIDDYKCVCRPGYTGTHCETGKYWYAYIHHVLRIRLLLYYTTLASSQFNFLTYFMYISFRFDYSWSASYARTSAYDFIELKRMYWELNVLTVEERSEGLTVTLLTFTFPYLLINERLPSQTGVENTAAHVVVYCWLLLSQQMWVTSGNSHYLMASKLCSSLLMRFCLLDAGRVLSACLWKQQKTANLRLLTVMFCIPIMYLC